MEDIFSVVYMHTHKDAETLIHMFFYHLMNYNFL
jgi:hypothetical protein